MRNAGFETTRRRALSEGLALVVALVWMVHPLQTQSVTYVVQRMASLSGLFCIGSLLCYARGRAPESAKSRVWFAGAAASWLERVGFGGLGARNFARRLVGIIRLSGFGGRILG